MNALFEKLLANNDIWNAQIVGKNDFCRNASNSELFTDYFDFCIRIAQYPVEYETVSFFLNEAELSLTIFSEKAEMDPQILALISEKREILVSTAKHIESNQAKTELSAQEAIEESNKESLQCLAKLEGRFNLINCQDDLDEILSEMAMLEGQLHKDHFTDEQKEDYTALTKDFSKLVSEAMEKIGHDADVEYNRKATTSFKKAFDLFKADEDKFKKHDSSLYELVSEYLFAYDAKRLFSETLIYYNHIYTYIFNKLDDNGKFRFTQFSFDVPKNIE